MPPAANQVVFVRAQAPWSQPSALFKAIQAAPGFQAKLLAVQTIAPTDFKLETNPDLAIITSQNAVQAIARSGEAEKFQGLPLACVGSKTADLAGSLLGGELRFTASTAKALEQDLLAKNFQGSVAYVKPKEAAHDFAQLESAVGPENWRSLVAYQTDSDSHNSALQDQLSRIFKQSSACDQAPCFLVYSYKCAQAFCEAVTVHQTAGSGSKTSKINLLAISAPVAEALAQGLAPGAVSIEVIPHPSERGFAQALTALFSPHLQV